MGEKVTLGWNSSQAWEVVCSLMEPVDNLMEVVCSLIELVANHLEVLCSLIELVGNLMEAVGSLMQVEGVLSVTVDWQDRGLYMAYLGGYGEL